MLQVLSIGNSFSQDAQRYLHAAAAADGVELTAVNLYIGGCSLWRHFRNLQEDSRVYDLQYNGESTDFHVSIREALLNREWDVVTLQQASHFSDDYKTYQPYLNALAAEVRRLAPKAKLAIHNTWAYEQGSERLHTMKGYTDTHDMLAAVTEAYHRGALDCGAELVIPAGQAMMKLYDSGFRAHRDGFHAGLGAGRYAVALTWYGLLTGKDPTENKLDRFDVDVPAEEIAAAKAAAAAAIRQEV